MKRFYLAVTTLGLAGFSWLVGCLALRSADGIPASAPRPIPPSGVRKVLPPRLFKKEKIELHREELEKFRDGRQRGNVRERDHLKTAPVEIRKRP